MCDIPQSLVADLNIRVVPALLNVGTDSYRDAVDITRSRFYDWLPDMPVPPTTSAPSPAAFMEAYEDALKKAEHVVSIHVSGKLSGIYNAAKLAARELATDRIQVLDSATLSMGLGWASLAAAEAARSGETLQGVLHSVQDTLSRVRVYVLLNTLEFLARSGRINLVQAGLSSLLNIKPIVEIKDGMIHGVARIRTWSRAVNDLNSRVRQLAPIEKLAVMHTNYRDSAQDFLGQFKDIIQPAATIVTDAAPALGVHAGPQALGIAAVIKKKS